MFILLISYGAWDDYAVLACYGPFDEESTARAFAKTNDPKISADIGYAGWAFEIMPLRAISPGN